MQPHARRPIGGPTAALLLLLLLLQRQHVALAASAAPTAAAAAAEAPHHHQIQHQQQQQQPPVDNTCPPAAATIVAGSPHLYELSPLSFFGQVADGRAWMVEFFTHSCRGCRRVAGHVAALSDMLAATHPHIAVGRLDCGADAAAAAFCGHAIGVTATPSFKVYHRGVKAIDYRADFFFIDMMLPFITNVAADLHGFSPLSRTPQQQQRQQRGPEESEDADDEDEDEYE